VVLTSANRFEKIQLIGALHVGGAAMGSRAANLRIEKLGP
jgi:hypothetical protein